MRSNVPTTGFIGCAASLALGLAHEPANAQRARDAHACEALASLALDHTNVTPEFVPAGPFSSGQTSNAPVGASGSADWLPAHCRVRIVLTPSADSNINSELWLPAEGWNGRFLVVGNGGFAGRIQGYADMQTALRAGYAAAGTDTGHTLADGNGAVFGYGHPERIVDFAYRAIHETTARSKELIDAFYAAPLEYSYFKGCSTGGRQAAMSAQRYPFDFDGIIGGSPANRMIYMHTAAVVREISVTDNPEQRIPAATAAMVNEAVMKACDVHQEGFLNNPRQCSFDFSALACASGASGDQCLSPGQLKTVETFYGGVHNGSGELIFSGQPLGNPLPELQGFDADGRPGYGFDTIRYWGFDDPDYDWRTFDLDRDLPIMLDRVGFVNAIDPDLEEFKANGGKLILYAGWGDTVITPENTVYYYESVRDELGPNQENWMRLFMVPGMGHCRGGPGPDDIDLLSALDIWVTQDRAPDQLIGTNVESGLTRPICRYPQFSEYDGSGDLNDASNWTCATP